MIPSVPAPVPEPAATSAIRTSAFQGQVTRPYLLEMLESFRDLQMGGLLRVTSGSHTADIHIENGRLRHATFAE